MWFILLLLWMGGLLFLYCFWLSPMFSWNVYLLLLLFIINSSVVPLACVTLSTLDLLSEPRSSFKNLQFPYIVKVGYTLWFRSTIACVIFQIRLIPMSVYYYILLPPITANTFRSIIRSLFVSITVVVCHLIHKEFKIHIIIAWLSYWFINPSTISEYCIINIINWIAVIFAVNVHQFGHTASIPSLSLSSRL